MAFPLVMSETEILVVACSFSFHLWFQVGEDMVLVLGLRFGWWYLGQNMGFGYGYLLSKEDTPRPFCKNQKTSPQ